MSGLFFKSKRKDFSGIETWDTSSVENMMYMFKEAKSFKQNINSWDTSKVEDMKEMLKGSPLEQNPPKWYKSK